MGASYRSNRAAVERATLARFRVGAVNMGGDILSASTAVTPFKDGDLRQRRRVVPTASGARVEWQSDHAAVQNKGSRQGRPFRNYTTGGTGPRFVEAGIQAVMRQLPRYFK